jgi:hypothetical protein
MLSIVVRTAAGAALLLIIVPLMVWMLSDWRWQPEGMPGG